MCRDPEHQKAKSWCLKNGISLYPVRFGSNSYKIGMTKFKVPEILDEVFKMKPKYKNDKNIYEEMNEMYFELREEFKQK